MRHKFGVQIIIIIIPNLCEQKISLIMQIIFRPVSIRITGATKLRQVRRFLFTYIHAKYSVFSLNPNLMKIPILLFYYSLRGYGFVCRIQIRCSAIFRQCLQWLRFVGGMTLLSRYHQKRGRSFCRNNKERKSDCHPLLFVVAFHRASHSRPYRCCLNQAKIDLKRGSVSL